MGDKMVEKERPLGITVLSILSFLGGISFLLLGLALLALGPTVGALVGEKEGMALGLVIGGPIGLALLLIGIIELAIGWGLWYGKSWAWWLSVVFSILGVLSIVSLNIVGAVISAIILWYLFKPHVKEYFGVEVGFST